MLFRSTPIRSTLQSPLGPITLATHENALVGVWFDGQRHQPDPTYWPHSTTEPMLRLVKQQLEQYFAKERMVFQLPLDVSSGTAFQQHVWNGLQEIPVGCTVSYSILSQKLGHATAVRAVACAVARNPISIVLPCHRVVGSNGALIGYAAGLERKRTLLELEAECALSAPNCAA